MASLALLLRLAISIRSPTIFCRSVSALPEELARSRSVVELQCESSAQGGVCNVYLVGTCHVSEKSCREVAAVIRYLKPEVVFLELCASRASVLKSKSQSLHVPTMGEMVKMWKKNHNVFVIVYAYSLAKMCNQLGISPDSEFRVAYEEAMKYGGRVILGDRPVQITLRRTWRKMPLWHKIKLPCSLLFPEIFLPALAHFIKEPNKTLKELIDDDDMPAFIIQEMSKKFPTIVETILHERDKCMSFALLNVASRQGSVVAVVGKGRLEGIRNHWKQPIVLKDLLEIPPQKSASSSAIIVRSIGIAFIGMAIISGICALL